MRPLNEQEKKTVRKLLLRCTEVLREGFRIDLSGQTDEWATLSEQIGSKRFCAFCAESLSLAYRKRFGEAFLFSERCRTFELRYHLNAYLCVKGYRRLRHISTLLFRKPTIERKCRSVEIDTDDVYRRSQRLAFRYFFGIRKVYRRTARDPYAKKHGSRYFRIPFYRFCGKRRLHFFV